MSALVAMGYAPTHAADDADSTIRIENPREGDRFLLSQADKFAREGRFHDALRMLMVLQQRRPGDRDLQIFIARVEVAADEHDNAIQRLQALSVAHPDWPRPRVELALAHEAAGDVRKAKAILIAELGKNPPPAVRRNIEARIRQLEDRQGFVGRVSLGVVPDSNISNGTSSDTVEFLNLPFRVNDEAKQQSGVRAEISFGGTLRSQWDRDVRVELDADIHHSEPLGDEGTRASDMRLGVGLRQRGQSSSLRIGTAIQPFYFDDALQRREHSVFLEAGRKVGSRVALVANTTLTHGDVAGTDEQDFRQWETTAGPKFVAGSSSVLQINGIYGLRSAEIDVHSFLRRGGSFNLVTAPADGYRLALSGALIRDVYQDVSVGFGRVQEDLITVANVNLVKTGLVIGGFSPSLGLGYNEVRSTIDLYDRHGYTLQLGFARPF